MISWDPVAPHPRDALPPFARPKRPPSTARALAEIPLLLGVAVLLTFVVKSLVAQAFFIPSPSMEPQLRAGDRVVVSRTAYRVHDPRRGDIIVFDSPVAADDDDRALPRKVIDEVLETMALKRPPETELIKRVIALSGETIEGRDGGVLIDGKLLSEPYLPAGTLTAPFGPTEVPPDHVFVLGDNRSNSQDSRFIGPIPIDTIVGRAIARVWPPTRVAFL